MSKAFDDRIGVAALIELGTLLAKDPISNTVVLAFTVQEEVGTRGAKVLASRGIRIQEAVRKGGGTDAMVLALADRGIPSVVTGVPVRSAHSHNCLVSLSD